MLKKILVALVLLFVVAGSIAAPLGAGFTYQGELQVSNSPADGEYDFQFELFDAANQGASAATTIFIENVTVTNGVFSTELDFGIGPFAGDQLWLEIRVRDGASAGGFTGLLPRQKLTATPYALHAEFVAAGSVGDQEINPAQVQQRVSGGCMAGSFVTAVNQDGSVVCANDDTGFSSVTGAEIVDGSIGSVDLAAGSVAATQLANNAIGTSAVQGGAITAAKIAADAISSPHVAPDSLTAADLAANSVGSSEIADNSVGSSELAASSVGSSEIVDGSVGNVDIISSQIQTRVSGSCDAGTYMSGINQDGTVQCTVLPIGFAFVLDDATFAGFSSLAIRDNGLPIISYYSFVSAHLKVFACGNTICSAGTPRILDSAGDVGAYTSIAIRNDGLPIISYYDASNTSLKLYACSDASCTAGTSRTLDGGIPTVGEYTSLAILANGLPIISYYDAGNGGLKVFACADASCSSGSARTLDSGGPFGDVGRYTSIAIRENGLPIISYVNVTNGDLKVYACNNTTCSTGAAATVDSASDVRSGTSIAIRSDGRPIISYFNNDNLDLLAFDCGDSACSTGLARTLDTMGFVGVSSSVAIRDSGLPIISYLIGFGPGVKIYTCETTSCSEGTARIVGIQDETFHPSVAIRDNGRPIISYSGDGSLKVYSCGDDLCGNN